MYENEDVPFNQKLLYIKIREDDNDMDMMTMENVPFNAKLIQTAQPIDDQSEGIQHHKYAHEQMPRPEQGELVQLENGAKWGFLKNIVNIDRFFDSGVHA